jgi:hypothetical protein
MMPNPVMPNGLVPTVAAYSMDEPGGVVRTDVAGGAARYALDWDRGPQRFQVTLILDALKFSVWTAFYHHIIKKGAVTFDMRLDSGFGTEPHAVNIMPGSYSAARTGGIAVVVSFLVEAENKVYEMSAADAAGLVDVYNAYGAGAHGLLQRLATFALVDTNVLDF